MCALRFLEKVCLGVAEFAKNWPQNAKNELLILHVLPQKPKIVEMWKLAQTAEGVRIMPELFVF